MACWVAPGIAAEMWGVPLAHVMSRIEDGSLSTTKENGFVFVNVCPFGETREPPRPEDRPATCAPASCTETEEEAELYGAGPDDAFSWKDIRVCVGRTRRPPATRR